MFRSDNNNDWRINHKIVAKPFVKWAGGKGSLKIIPDSVCDYEADESDEEDAEGGFET